MEAQLQPLHSQHLWFGDPVLVVASQLLLPCLVTPSLSCAVALKSYCSYVFVAGHFLSICFSRHWDPALQFVNGGQSTLQNPILLNTEGMWVMKKQPWMYSGLMQMPTLCGVYLGSGLLVSAYHSKCISMCTSLNSVILFQWSLWFLSWCTKENFCMCMNTFVSLPISLRFFTNIFLSGQFCSNLTDRWRPQQRLNSGEFWNCV